MGTVLPFLGPAKRPQPTPYERFQLARRHMLTTYREWVRTGPPTDDMDAEAECTLGAMHGIQVFEVPHA